MVAGVGHDPTNLAGLVFDANSTADHFTAERNGGQRGSLFFLLPIISDFSAANFSIIK